MRLFLNELSLHGQFHHLDTFRESMARVMELRSVAKRFSYPVYCSVRVSDRLTTPTDSFVKVVNHAFTHEQVRDIMIWIGNEGPFWEEELQHDSETLLEYMGHDVTESSVGEAAYYVENQQGGGLVSFIPSDWDVTPIAIKKNLDWDNGEPTVSIPNYCNRSDLEADLQELEPPISTWGQLESKSRNEYSNLTFSSDCFEPLAKLPFKPGSVSGIRRRLKTLNDLMNHMNQAGGLTEEGVYFWEQHFVGASARFSDSSDDEKNRFENDLTFPHPLVENKFLFCSWHGKVSGRIRIHFAVPSSGDPHLYVVYVGDKITLQ